MIRADPWGATLVIALLPDGSNGQAKRAMIAPRRVLPVRSGGRRCSNGATTPLRRQCWRRPLGCAPLAKAQTATTCPRALYPGKPFRMLEFLHIERRPGLRREGDLLVRTMRPESGGRHHTKNKAGPTPCFKFLKYRTGRLRLFFLEWPRLVAPPVFPPSDLDHTRPTDNSVICWPPYCEQMTRT